MPRTLTRFALLLALPALLVLAGCDRHDDDDHLEEIRRVEVRDRATNTLYAFWVDGQNDDEFQLVDGGVPSIPVGEEIALNVLFIDEDGRQAQLSASGEYRLGVRLATAQDGVAGPSGIVAFSAHGDHADVEGVAAGETHLVFQLMHGNHSDFDSRPVRIVVAGS